RDVRRAQREGVVTTVSTDLAAFEIASELQSITRKRQGALDYPKGFFPAIAEHLAKKGLAECRLGYFEGAPVATVVVLFDRWRMRALYAYAASLPNRKALATGIQPLLLWEAMEKAFLDGFTQFNFGSTASHNKSLLAYKRRFGASERPLRRTYFPAGSVIGISEGGMLNRLASPVFRNMPLSLFKRLTPLLLKEVL
ncbi:MAG: GNAT family N-acetyltransferase, partial [Kiloniellales bacterium]|nr:GNAT family N-acetyltransferase [Kiloniellales bacterium]